jgi:hypothetical protein
MTNITYCRWACDSIATHKNSYGDLLCVDHYLFDLELEVLRNRTKENA